MYRLRCRSNVRLGHAVELGQRLNVLVRNAIDAAFPLAHR
nr:MAG TPA: hypothetical protein [Caudoviricetes sp.]